MAPITQLPAIPLFTHDPFFSIWSLSKHPASGVTRHWTGAEKAFEGTMDIDGSHYRFLSKAGDKPMKLVELKVTPLSTVYAYENAGVRLTVKFTSPLLLDDPEILSTPISFVQFDVQFIDGKTHKIGLSLRVPEQVCYSGENAPKMRGDLFEDGDLKYAYMGQSRQKPLSGSGDHVTIDWGYLFYCTADGNLVCNPENWVTALNFYVKTDKPFHSTLMVGYDDVASINYFGRMLPAYYARNGKTITQALREFHQRQDEILARCDAFDETLMAQARELGGEDYELIVCASYRQSIAAHKLVADVNGDILFISKENDSNGCGATVDVSYPSVPLYLLYNPELVRGMCRPILKFAKMDVWPYDFAPHDAGRYPVLNGQVYGAALRTLSKQNSDGDTNAPYYLYPAGSEVYDIRGQMPVEESANMLLMLAAAGRADGKYPLASENLDLLRKWCGYLLEYGEDPGEQLCTDDFAGHLAHNVNLAAKAIMGVAAFARILEDLGLSDEAAGYREKARAMGESWYRRADLGDHTALAFGNGGWSLKYNLVWDKLFGFGILPEEFYRKELSSYLPRVNPYGIPLDSRADYTKADWILWTAAMAEDRQTFDALVAPVARFLRETPDRVPFSDWYDTVTGCYESFTGRSVVGGNFMPLLMKAWAEA